MPGPWFYGCPFCDEAVIRWSWKEHVEKCDLNPKRKPDDSEEKP